MFSVCVIKNVTFCKKIDYFDNFVNQDSERQDIKPLEEMKATDCGALISNITKTQDALKLKIMLKIGIIQF